MPQESKLFTPLGAEAVIRTFNLCFLGFGNVNRTVVRLLEDRAHDLRERYGITYRITGIASRRLGWVVDPQGFESASLLTFDPDREGHDFSRALKGSQEPGLQPPRDLKITPYPKGDVRTWLSAARANVLFEATSLNVENGQPAVDHIRAALEHGAHAITANKGPIVHAYRELRDLARLQQKK